MARIEAVYRPYHETLRRLLFDTHRQFGYAVLIDCHSMPAGVRVAESGQRPDFTIGDRFGTSCAPSLSQAALDSLRAMDYAVSHNRPYAGGFITEHYGQPAKGFHAMQIEVSRGLYLDDRTLERKPGFGRLAGDIATLLSHLCSADRFEAEQRPIAAE